MTRDGSLGIAALGGGLAVGALLWRHSRNVISDAHAVELSGWIVPVPTLADRPVVVSNEFHASMKANDPHEHLGVDLMFRRRDARDLASVFPPKTSNGSLMFFMPDEVPALAAAAGTASFADMTGMGNTVIVQHPNGWATYYTHLATLAVKRGDIVRAGQQLGTIGGSPIEPQHLKHLHFELWKGGRRTGAVDPKPYLASWTRVTTPWAPPGLQVARNSLSVTEQIVSPSQVLDLCRVPAQIGRVRNGGTSSYRMLGERGDAYPEWVRALKGKAGVYIIRDAETHECLYVGSSAGRLYDTLTRHFQTWRRFKGFWRGQYAEGADPGLTYPRADVEVAVRLTSPGDALDEEMRTIARLRPRDNQIGQPESAADEVPF